MTRGSARRCVRVTAGWGTAFALAAGLAACTTSGHPAVAPAPSHARATATTAPTPTDSPTPTSSAPATTTAPTTTDPASTTAAASTPAAPTTGAAQSTCTSLTVRVLPGGASFGQEIAAVQYTNSGSSTCVLAGYPTVTLLLRGRMIGQPSQPSSTAVSERTLRPGEVAQSLVHDYTQTCQAPLSDSVKVQAPGLSLTTVRPDMQMRACVLRVDKLGAPD